MEMCEVIARHMRAREIWPNCTAEDIANSTNDVEKLTPSYYNALAFFKEKGFYHSLDEITDPQEGMYVHIRTEGRLDNFQYKKGKWVDLGEMLI